MPVELDPIITASFGGTALLTTGGSLNLAHGEPSAFSLDLNNEGNQYGYKSSVAMAPRDDNPDPVVISVAKAGTWNSPDLIIEDYDLADGIVTISGRCRLSQLDRDDQLMADIQDTTVAAALSSIASQYGLSVSGAPTRSLKGPYHCVGNPLQWFREVLGSAHTFRMGTGTTILVEPVTSHSSAGTWIDYLDLEILKIKRTSEIRNRATVERIVEGGAEVVLVDQSRTGGDSLGVNQPIAFNQPSRSIRIVEATGYRGQLALVFNGSGGPLHQNPWGAPVFNSVEPITEVVLNYTVTPAASEWGPYTPQWRLLIVGVPLDQEPELEESYSATASVGSGSRPYPEAFTSLLIDDQSGAQEQAEALVAVGTRLGNLVSAQRRVDANIPMPNQQLAIVDYKTGFGESPVIEVAVIAWAEDGDTGTIIVDGAWNEAE